ncbi:MAG: hypothetical protein QOJ98_2547 [Acidobacteriota bacterium]|nr:hypothetical protein [Acidobacteriota bacterium]
MTLFARTLKLCFACLLLVALGTTAAATEMNGVLFDPSPPGEWRCGLTNDDLPGLAAERMVQPLAAGCARGDARAYAVIVDLSDAHYAMSAEQMAADAEDQLPSEWRVSSKSYDVVSLASGPTAAYSRLVGRGDGFTFVSGQAQMVAISLNVPLLFQDESGAPRQAIAVFRVRSTLPAAGASQKKLIDELDLAVRDWAGTVRPVTDRPISARDFEVAALARTGGSGSITATPGAPAARPEPSGNDRIPAALNAAMQGRATESDLTVLEDAGKRFGQVALGSMAQALRADLHRSSLQDQQQQIISAAMASAPERATDILSRFLIAAIESGDQAAAAAAVKISGARGWPLRSLSPLAAETVAAAMFKGNLTSITPANDRAFLELASSELLLLVLRAKTVPHVEEIARHDRDQWRMKDRRQASKAAYLVQYEKEIGVLERQQATDVYRFRALTNLFDVYAIHP